MDLFILLFFLIFSGVSPKLASLSPSRPLTLGPPRRPLRSFSEPQEKKKKILRQDSFSPPQLLALLPVLPGLVLGATPSALDVVELLLPLLGNLGCGAAQADEELRAVELLGQTHTGPLSGVFLA